MASAGLSDELTCSICLDLYTDPVYLSCRHNFCRSCIVKELNSQDGCGGFFCPNCRTEYAERPALEKNSKLDRAVENFLSSHAEIEEIIVLCTYCITSHVPAVKSCLHCEVSLCGQHLVAHNKAVDHMLIEPTDFEKCLIHDKDMEYYCLKDGAYLCLSCCLSDEHREHELKHLHDATGEIQKVWKYQDKLNSLKTQLQKRVQNLIKHKRNIREKVSNMRKNVDKLFMDTNEQLEMVEKKVLSEISRQEQEIVFRVSSGMKTLSMKMCHLQMRHVTDPIRQESDIAVCGYGDIKPEDHLDEVLISHQSMKDVLTKVASRLGFHVPDILLDEDTAHRELKLSDDLKTATRSNKLQYRPDIPGRFLHYPQVLSNCDISSGRHYWEVESTQLGSFGIGVAYTSIATVGLQSSIAYSHKVWCLFVNPRKYLFFQDSYLLPLDIEPSSCRLGVFLDYEAGRLSFYELCDPIRHIHTITASFTEPLRIITRVATGGSITII